jgi:hypothetical protein
MEFLHWITMYHGVISNTYGKERKHVLSIIDEDDKFDKWLTDHEKEMEKNDKRPTPRGSSGGGETLSKEEVLRMPGTVFRGD